MKIQRITKLSTSEARYDIEVEDTHCFFANDILVHNCRFGKDSNGRPFFEGSRTGPIFTPKAFSTHAKSKNSAPDIVLRAGHYDDVWDIVTKSSLMKLIPKNTKVVCELFYNPMGELVDDGIKFVSIKYDKSKLGSLMTLVLFKVVTADTGEEHPDAANILSSLYKASTPAIKIINPALETIGDIDINAFADPILSLSQKSVDVLSSLKHADRESKKNVQAMIQTVKDELADYILNHKAIIGKFKLGPDIEGLVLDIDGRLVKVTTPTFKAGKAAEKSINK